MDAFDVIKKGLAAYGAKDLKDRMSGKKEGRSFQTGLPFKQDATNGAAAHSHDGNHPA